MADDKGQMALACGKGICLRDACHFQIRKFVHPIVNHINKLKIC